MEPSFLLESQRRPSYNPHNAAELANIFLETIKEPVTQTSLKNLDSPMLLKNINKACHRIIQAIDKNEKITLVTDHDCDGQSSCSVLVWTLRYIFQYENFEYFISHRTQEGYGLTEGVINRIYKSHTPSLIITADCGISCHAQISKLREKNVDVIVTDHHTVPSEGVPADTYCVINPQQEGCMYPDKNIAGCFVAWLVMAAVRKIYSEQRSVQLPSMGQCLDFVCVGTIADCMDLKRSQNNRIAVKYGLMLIRKKSKPAWTALLGKFNSFASAEFLSFKLIPLLNADGRLSDALTSVKYLTSKDLIDAQYHLAHLVDKNEQRKILTAKQMQSINREHFNEAAIVVYLERDGHSGIHGITASKLCQEYNVPVIVFSKSFKDGILTASARSPQDFSLKNSLDLLNQQYPNLLEQYGGHHQAAGLSILVDNFEQFKNHFICQTQRSRNKKTKQKFSYFCQLEGQNFFTPRFWRDFEQMLEPFGKEFAKPVFAIQARLVSYSLIGEAKNHISLKFIHQGRQFKALIFFQKDPLKLIEAITDKDIVLLGTFNYDIFLGKQTVTFYLKAFFLKEEKILLLEEQKYRVLSPTLTEAP